MLSSAAVLESNDISVRCHVRRSPAATDPQYDEPVEMNCIMRSWLPPKGSRASSRLSLKRFSLQKSSIEGPELVLKTIPAYFGSGRTSSPRNKSPARVASFNRHKVSPASPEHAEEEVEKPVVIPMVEVVDVESSSSHEHPSKCKIHVTTKSLGYWEFAGTSQNSHDILLAFLKTSLPVEHVREDTPPLEVSNRQRTRSNTGSLAKNSDTEANILGDSSGENDDMDVDALHAQHCREQARTPWSRRLGRLMHSVGQLSGNLCDTVTCCHGSSEANTVASGGNSVRRTATRTNRPITMVVDEEDEDKIRRKEKDQRMADANSLSPKPRIYNPNSGRLEMDDEQTPTNTMSGSNNHLAPLPSGLSLQNSSSEILQQ